MAELGGASADALEDDFVLEETAEGDEEELAGEAVAVSQDLAAEVESEGEDQRAVRAGSKKRKATKEPATKAKRSKAVTHADTEPVALAPPSMQLDYYQRKLKAALPKATSLELDELALREKDLLDVSSVPASSRNDLAAFLRAALPDVAQQLGKTSKKQGSPRVIILSAAALRVADLCRQVKTLAGKGEVAKLFAKHCKLSEHEEYCRKNAFSVAVATPARLEKLMHADPPALLLDSVSHIVLDVHFLDSKKRSVLENEGREVIMRDILGNTRLREKLSADRLKVVFL